MEVGDRMVWAVDSSDDVREGGGAGVCAKCAGRGTEAQVVFVRAFNHPLHWKKSQIIQFHTKENCRESMVV